MNSYIFSINNSLINILTGKKNNRYNRHLSLTTIVFILSALSQVAVANKMPESYGQCIACHGDKAQGNAQLNSPSLAGKSASYITRQLHNFANGLRGSHNKDTLGMQMVAISKQLNFNKDVPELSAYLAALPAISQVQNTTGDLKNGSRYYQGKCGACHGGQAQGNEIMNAPKLSGQSVEYLKRQMLNFTQGIRGTHPEDKFGRQMAMMAKTTSGQELEDILHYIANQE
ncbi:c-type cytochrome [Thalassotalea piscium]|uniref:Cytochrome c oxidase subunit 2 n=1 Tax=Thalassotalea piscium TaxID=1230533 RepID=A0A7X0TSY3_9GAMM|nr:c-type cytochrome [Thalassotalea piscium]MBB6542520.1 cytochrome c oxidase subunit 2 [Thalassotalea piscium]